MNTTKTILFATLALAALIASPLVITAQEDQVATITRHITDAEYSAAVEQIHEFRAEQNRLETQMQVEGIDNSQRISELDSKIAKLMPILDKHQQQTFAKYYIEPERKQYLETVEKNLRTDVYDALIGQVNYLSVNLNEKDKIVEVIVDDAKHISTIEKILENHPTDVEYSIAVDQYFDAACANQTDDCDPIVGGIEIEGDCTLGLPVRKGSWPFYSYHFITAGHCIADNDDMNQPNEASPEIGDSTDSYYESTCDCAMSDKTTGTTSNSKVWRSSNNYLTIISEATSRPATGTDVAVFSVITGFVQAEVSNPNHTFYFNGVNWDLVQINTAMALGDSGSPMTNASGNQILGILKGADSSNTDFSPWDAVDSRFGGLNLH